jgi:6-phosphogluconolactonase (cycloisomerase 2 family)
MFESPRYIHPQNFLMERTMKKTILCAAAGMTMLVLGLALILTACSGSSSTPAAVVNPTIPKFLLVMDGTGAGTNVNVFPINQTTGVLGSAVTGSPFDMGMADGMTLAVHPNGRFVYGADGSDGSIHALSVNETTGVPTPIGTKLVNTSGSFYEPNGSAGNSATHVITITPNGNFLYSANNDANVGAYKINTDGTLAHIADLNIGACDTGAVTANNKFVWVTDTCGSSGPWNVFALKIGTDGSLTQTSSVTLTGVYSWLWSIQVNPVANFLYVGDEGGNAQLYSFSIAADGSLTQLGPQLVENNSSDVRDIAHSPDGKFFYTTDDDNVVHAFSEDITTGAITELSASPYPGGAGQVVVDLTGHFVYFGDQEGTGQVIGYTRDMTTGALTLIGNTSTANGNAHAVAIIR